MGAPQSQSTALPSRGGLFRSRAPPRQRTKPPPVGRLCQWEVIRSGITAGMGTKCRIWVRSGDVQPQMQTRNTESVCAWMPRPWARLRNTESACAWSAPPQHARGIRIRGCSGDATLGTVAEHRICMRSECVAACADAERRIRMHSDCITAGMGAECRVCGRLGDARAKVRGAEQRIRMRLDAIAAGAGCGTPNPPYPIAARPRAVRPPAPRAR